MKIIPWFCYGFECGLGKTRHFFTLSGMKKGLADYIFLTESSAKVTILI
jgi:hypothetical protein